MLIFLNSISHIGRTCEKNPHECFFNLKYFTLVDNRDNLTRFLPQSQQGLSFVGVFIFHLFILYFIYNFFQFSDVKTFFAQSFW